MITYLSYFLRVAANILAPVLCLLNDNNTFRIGIFPQICKVAKITSLFKSGKADSVTNYRTISILSCFSKFMEKVIHQRLTNFFLKPSVLAVSQNGFQNNRSITHAILDVLTTTYDQINIIENIGIIILDFKKAFNTVCHATLLSKLQRYGLRGSA